MHPSFINQKRTQVLLGTISFALVALSLVVKIAETIWIKNRFTEVSREYTYVGQDHPETWPIQRKDILMAFDNPQHFRLDTPDGAAEWSAQVPGDGLLHLGPYRQPYTISLFHQLRCLDIVRVETVRSNGGEPTAVGRHCLNYLRQMIQCRGDLELESFQFASHKNPIDLNGIYECKDWEAVYREAEKNQAEYREWVKTRR